MPQTVDFKHHITTNYEIKGQGATGNTGSGIWPYSGTESYGTWDAGSYKTVHGSFGDDEHWVAVGHMGYNNMWARTNKGNLYTCGNNAGGVSGTETYDSSKFLKDKVLF